MGKNKNGRRKRRFEQREDFWNVEDTSPYTVTSETKDLVVQPESDTSFPVGFENNLGSIGKEKEEEEKVILMGPAKSSVSEKNQNERKPLFNFSFLKAKKEENKTQPKDKKNIFGTSKQYSRTVSGNVSKKKLNLGNVFLGFTIVLILLIMLGTATGWFGALQVSVFKFWPLLLIFIGLSLFKVHRRRYKFLGSVVAVVALIISSVFLVQTGNVARIVLAEEEVEEVRTISDFSSIIFEGMGTMKVRQGNVAELTIIGDKNIVTEVITSVEGGVLRVGYRNPLWNMFLFDKSDITVVVSAPTLRLLEVRGDATVTLDTIETTEFEAVITGSGDITARINAETIVSRIIGTGDITLSGTTHRQLVYITGSGNYNAENLKSSEAGVRILGIGDVTLTVADELDVSISGNGTVQYLGDPRITKKTNAEGSVQKIISQPSVLKGTLDLSVFEN